MGKIRAFSHRRKRTPEEIEYVRQFSFRHGYSDKPGVWKTWSGMKQRICNPNCKDYSSYGGRGLDIDPRWRESFESFLDDMGERPEGMSIGRIDNDLGYWPDNCRWETIEEQSNNRRPNRFIDIGGERMTLAQAARRIGISRQAMRYRVEAGWDPNKSATAKDQGRASKAKAALR